MDLAASVQQVVDEAILRMGGYVHKRTGLDNIALAGGVALNCVATGRLSSEGPFRTLWTQPAAGDAGGALGAALWFWHHRLKQPRTVEQPDAMRGGFLGPRIAPQSAEDDAMLGRLGARWESLPDDALQTRIAESIAAGKVVAVARGAMEFGPRALGNRSILGDARSPTMQSHMNLKVKFRESFRPFAPMVLAEDAGQYFATRQESPYMLLVYPVARNRRLATAADGKSGLDLLKQLRSDIPAVTHVDYSARVQTVDPIRNPLLHGVLQRFRAATGCSVIINTSFNVRGEPIVSTVEDAYRCWMATEIDCLVIGNRWLARDRQQNRPLTDDERKNWLRRFELD
jgi:carbamoyltransferase